MYIEDKHCPICGSNDATNIGVLDIAGNAKLHSFDLNLSYICACMKCGIVFVPRHFLPKEKEKK